MSERPTGVAVLAILIMILGILGIVGGIIMAFFLATGFSLFGGGAVYVIPGIIVAAVSVIYLIAGIGLWMVKSWGRILTIILAILLIIGSVIDIIAGIVVILYLIPGVIGLVLGILIVWYLTREEVSAYFS